MFDHNQRVDCAKPPEMANDERGTSSTWYLPYRRPAVTRLRVLAVGTTSAYRFAGRRVLGWLVTALITAVVVSSCGLISSDTSTTTVDTQFTPSRAIEHNFVNLPARATVSGAIGAPGGPYLRDSNGSVVILHGVNAVYKHPPFELYPAPGKPWNFSSSDAQRIAALGFNVVRLGILWQGLEPGTGGPNQPSICTPGPPGHPHMFNSAVADAYLSQVAKTVDLLGKYHIYTLLDMHQDVYNQVFGGEGAPAWAVCTNPVPIFKLPGRWSTNYANPGLDVAVSHFWSNNVIGNLQGEYDHVWSVVASYFKNNPWIVGYDPYNEPFSREVTVDDATVFDSQLECFYTGRAHPGALETGEATTCPSTDPAYGVIPTIESADPNHLVFIEPDIYTTSGKRPNLLGPMNYRSLVFNFHVYCSHRSPRTGAPTSLKECVNQQIVAMGRRQQERVRLSTPAQPGGPAWFMSEFGATRNLALLTAVTANADALNLGWSYWAWKYYNDPTGSSQESLVSNSGKLEPSASVLSRTYPQVVSGIPVGYYFDPTTGTFSLTFSPLRNVHTPTSIFVSASHYPNGYCAKATDGTIVSSPGASHLLVLADDSATSVTIDVTSGKCKPAS